MESKITILLGKDESFIDHLEKNASTITVNDGNSIYFLPLCYQKTEHGFIQIYLEDIPWDIMQKLTRMEFIESDK